MKTAHRTDRRAAPGRAAAALLALLVQAACSGQGTAPGAAPAQPAPAVPVTVATVETKAVPIQLRAIGNVVPSSTVSVQARVNGALDTVHFEEGDEVSAGQVLFTIDPRPYEAAVREAEAALARNRELLAKAEADVVRFAGLVEDDFVTREQFDQASAQAGSLRAAVQGDEAALDSARLDLSFCTIRAPFTGQTGSLMVHAGNQVKANDKALVVINRIRPVQVGFSVPEQYLEEIRSRRAAGSLGVEAMVKRDHEEGLAGELVFVDNSVDTATGTIMLKAAFANEQRSLWPGQYVDVLLTLGTQPEAVVAPTTAILSGQGGSYVFVVGGDGTVQSRPVTVDRKLGPETVVAEGLAAGERVVTDGQIRLVPGARVEIRNRAPGI